VDLEIQLVQHVQQETSDTYEQVLVEELDLTETLETVETLDQTLVLVAVEVEVLLDKEHTLLELVELVALDS